MRHVPCSSLNVESNVRVALSLGFLYEYHFVETEYDVYLDVGYLVPHVGATARLGPRKGAFLVQAAWAPTIRLVHGGDVRDADRKTRGTALGTRILAGFALANFFAAFSLRIDDLDPLVEGIGSPFTLGIASGGTF